MKKPVVPRIAGLLVLYLGVFTFLVVLQFSRQRNFTLHVGDMTISGHYGESSQDDISANLDELIPEGDLSIVFGGMEFRITASGGDFAFLHSDGKREYPAVLGLTLKDDSAVIRFTEADDPGARLELVFSSLASSGGPGLRIAGSFMDDYTGAEIPFRPLRNAQIRSLKDGDFSITADGLDFSFGSSRLDAARRVLILDMAAPAVVYRAVSGQESFTLADYVQDAARAMDQYTARVSQWQDLLFAAWTRTPTASLDNEELITAYITDSIHRGNYKEVIARIPRSFLDSTRRTYVSSVFLGRLDRAQILLAAAERERTSRLTELLANGELAEFLAEPHTFAENAIRGNTTLIDQGIALFSRLETPALNLVPMILEARVDLTGYRSEDTSLESLIEPALLLITESLRKDEIDGRILVFEDNDGELTANTEFNLRLGAALDHYGQLTGLEDWAALGRSLILSVLAQTDTVGMVSPVFTLSDDDTFTASREARFSAARFYRYLHLGNYPRVERIAGGINGWAWTAGSSIAVTQSGNITDIAVTFPVGETHYIILRGIRPFTKIQLYGIDYRTDPQFERYDSSGWSYSSSEQSLLLKVKHQQTVEHIVIYTAAPPPLRSPPPSPEPAPEAVTAE
jgi:hypothetical protein